MRNVVAAGLALLCLVAPAAVAAGEGRTHVRIVFFDFYDDHVTLRVDGEVLWSGDLDVSKANESTGLSMIREADLPACSEIEVVSRRFTDRRRLCLSDGVKVLYIAGGRNGPHISTSDSDVIALD